MVHVCGEPASWRLRIGAPPRRNRRGGCGRAGALPAAKEAVVLVSTRLSEVRGFSDFFTGARPRARASSGPAAWDHLAGHVLLRLGMYPAA